MRKVSRFFADLYYLTKPYFVSEEWRSAWALLILLIALNLGQVGLGLAQSFSRNIYYTALQQKDAGGFFRGIFWFTPRPHGWPMPGFIWFAVTFLLMGVVANYLQSWLQIRWQRWMTARFVEDWLDGHAHFRMMLTNSVQGVGADNPDQRIQEDIEDVSTNSLTFILGILSNVVTVVSYGGLLWALSGPLVLLGLHIPGYLFWAAIVYSILATWITHLVGRPLARLSFTQQRLRGNFRFALLKVRENTEAIALSGGEGEERRGIRDRFAAFYGNFIDIMNRSAWLTLVTGGLNEVSGNFALLINAPRFFSGRITFGTLMQVVSLFGELQDAFLWFMSQYAALAGYAAQIERLATFRRALDSARALPDRIAASAPLDDRLSVRDLSIALPDGRPLLETRGFEIMAHGSTAIVGASGAGKSTLFRALAGIWPFATGHLSGPPLGSLFLPQRPYLPEGTLRRVLCYPQHPGEVTDERLVAVLAKVGLPQLAGSLDQEAPWSQRLSPGEQQRVALARALLIRPSWLFLDEATASLDPAAEAELYATLRREMPELTLVSITHRDAVARLHDRVLRVEPEGIRELEAA